MAWKALLVGCESRDLAADEEHALEDRGGLVGDDRIGPVRAQLLSRRDFLDRQQPAAWQRQRALAEHAGMQVAGGAPLALRSRDQVERFGQTARVIPMIVRENDGVDLAEARGETGAVVLDGEFHGPRVEQDRASEISPLRRDEEGEAV